MKKITPLIIIPLIFLIGGTVILNSTRINSLLSQEELEALKIVLPQANSFSKISDEPKHYKAYKKTSLWGTKELVGIAFLTTDLAEDIRGYNGPIKIMVGLTPQGTITKIHIIKHNETASYVQSLDQFIDQFATLGINNSFKLGQDIDGITGATITCKAITGAIKKSLSVIASEIPDTRNSKAISSDVKTKDSKETKQIKQKLTDNGIIPVKAKYWKEIDE